MSAGKGGGSPFCASVDPMDHRTRIACSYGGNQSSTASPISARPSPLSSSNCQGMPSSVNSQRDHVLDNLSAGGSEEFEANSDRENQSSFFNTPSIRTSSPLYSVDQRNQSASLEYTNYQDTPSRINSQQDHVLNEDFEANTPRSAEIKESLLTFIAEGVNFSKLNQSMNTGKKRNESSNQSVFPFLPSTQMDQEKTMQNKKSRTESSEHENDSEVSALDNLSYYHHLPSSQLLNLQGPDQTPTDPLHQHFLATLCDNNNVASPTLSSQQGPYIIYDQRGHKLTTFSAPSAEVISSSITQQVTTPGNNALLVMMYNPQFTDMTSATQQQITQDSAVLPLMHPQIAANTPLVQRGGQQQNSILGIGSTSMPENPGYTGQLVNTSLENAIVIAASNVSASTAASSVGSSGGELTTSLNDCDRRPLPINLYLLCDDGHLSEYQALIRKQLELFEAQKEDADSKTQGRKKPVLLGQVGIRCRHCKSLSRHDRGKGSVYYPAQLNRFYQAAQNMASSHLSVSCTVIDPYLRERLIMLRDRKDTASGGKQYWADGAKALGCTETEDGCIRII